MKDLLVDSYDLPVAVSSCQDSSSSSTLSELGSDLNEIRHVSASSIKLYEACPTRWYYRYVIGDKEESTPAMELGTKVHSYLEDYLVSGTIPDQQEIAGEIAMAGLYLLDRSRDKQVELALDTLQLPGQPIPFKGFIDCLYSSHDLEDFPEILDHKTTSGWRYAKSPDELAFDTQLIIYAKHVLAHCDSAQVRLSHIAYLTKPPYEARKSSIVVTREHVDKVFQTIYTKVEEMLASAKKPVETLPKNNKQCYSYGKRCPYYAQCHQQILPDTGKTENRSEPIMTEKQKSVLSKLKSSPAKAAMLNQATSGEPQNVGAEPQDLGSDSGSATVIDRFIQDCRVTPVELALSPVELAPSPVKEATLFVSCATIKGSIPMIQVVLGSILQEIADSRRVKHIGLIQFGEGWELLNAKLLEIPQDSLGDCYIDGNSLLYNKCGQALHHCFSRVVIAH